METFITKRENGSRRVSIKLASECKVEQHHLKDVNINSIMRKYTRTNLISQRTDSPSFGDFTNAQDFHLVQNRILLAQSDFMSLPSDVRGMFDNDPGSFLDFVGDPENADAARELGLLPKLETPVESIPLPELDPGPAPVDPPVDP